MASTIGYIKIYIKWSMGNDVTTLNKEVPYQLAIRLLLLPKFDKSSPFVNWDKEVCHMIMC